jgi:MFS family permease
MAPNGSGAPLVPPLPPSPMQSDRPPSSFRDVPLPWIALVLAVPAGLVPALAGMLQQGWAQLASPASAAVYVGTSLAFVVLTVLGAAIVDRLCPRWPRSLRWMVGMALHGFIPVTLVFSLSAMMFGQFGAALLSVLLQMAYGVVSGALTGLALGLAADRAEGLYLRSVWAGLIAGLVRTVVYAPVLLASLAAYHGSTRSLGATYWGCLVAGQCAFGVLLALAIAACLLAAWRRRAGGTDPLAVS